VAENRQLILDLLARDKTSQATRRAADNLDGVADAAEDAAKASERLGDESDRADDQVGKFGRSAKTAAQHVDDLDHEIENVERELRQLAVAWKEAESAAERADLSKAIRRTQKDLRDLNKNKGLLGALIPKPAEVIPQAVDLGAKTGTSFLSSFAEKASKVGPLGPIAVGMGLYMAPLIGANIAAGVLGAAGAGGVIGGLALAARDSRVKSAAKGLGKEILTELELSAGAFVPAALDGIDEIRGSFRSMSGDLKSIFDNSARNVGPLIRGVTGLIERTVDGAEKAIAGARPVILALERNLPRVGDALGDVLESLSDNGPTAAVALTQLFDIIEGGIRTVGGMINGFTEFYGFLAQTGVLGNEARNAWIAYDVAAQGAAGASRDLAPAMNEVTTEAKDQVHALTELSEVLRAQTDPVFGMLRAQRELAEANKATTESAEEHSRKSPEYQEALRREAEAALALEAAAGAVAQTSDGKMTPALKATLRAAGMTEPEIRDLAAQFANAKRQGDAFAKTYNATVKVNTADLTRAKRLYDAFRNKKISVDVFVRQHALNKVLNQGGDRMFRAEGGPVQAGVPYIVGEKRPEVFVPESNGTIVPSVGAFMAGGRSGGSSATTGGGASAGAWVAIRGDSVIDALTQAIASRVSARGGRAAQLGIRFT
jgi:methyl-accepting chemotaxis protein